MLKKKELMQKFRGGQKMRFDVLTLFPEMFEPIKQSIIGKAAEKDLVEILYGEWD